MKFFHTPLHLLNFSFKVHKSLSLGCTKLLAACRPSKEHLIFVVSLSFCSFSSRLVVVVLGGGEVSPSPKRDQSEWERHAPVVELSRILHLFVCSGISNRARARKILPPTDSVFLCCWMRIERKQFAIQTLGRPAKERMKESNSTLGCPIDLLSIKTLISSLGVSWAPNSAHQNDNQSLWWLQQHNRHQIGQEVARTLWG